MAQELWKQIPSHPNYEASTHGRIRSLGARGKAGVLRKLYIRKRDGYAVVGMADSIPYKVHRLVAETFLPNPAQHYSVNHINGDRADNRVENLEWADRKHQRHDVVRRGTVVKSLRYRLHMYDAKTGELLGTYPTVMAAYKDTGISRDQIYEVLNGRFKQSKGRTFKKEVISTRA